MVAGECTDEARRIAVRLILQHTKDEKLPEGNFEFWVDGSTWTIGRAISDDRPVALEAVR